MASNAWPLVGESQARNVRGEAPKMLLIADERNHQSRSSFPNTWGNLYCSNLSITCGHIVGTPVSPMQWGKALLKILIHTNKFKVLLQIIFCHHLFETAND